MKSGRWKANQQIIFSYPAPVDDPVLLYTTDNCSNQIEVIFSIDRRHFGCLSTYKCHIMFFTGFYHSGDHLLYSIGIYPVDPDIIEKEEWCSTMNENIIYRMIDQVLSYSIVFAGCTCYTEFCSDTICTGDQNRSGPFIFIECIKPAEAAKFRQDICGKGLFYQRLDSLYRFVSLLNIYSGFSVVQFISLL